MSIFPAYANSSESKPSSSETASEEWLNLSSFKIDVIPTPDSELKLHKKHFNSENDKDETLPVVTKRKKRKKDKKRKRTSKEDSPRSSEDEYYVDRKRTMEFKNVKTIARPSAPKYYVKYRLCQKISRKRKFRRYYQIIPSERADESASDDEAKITRKDLDKPIEIKNDSSKSSFQHEEEMTKTTAHYNRSLADEPHNIELWLKYVNFQDTVFQFEKTYRKGSIAKGLRVTAERKLCILDKALVHNPNCEELLRTRLNIAVSVYPADELQTQLGKLVQKEQGNIILWQGYIEATQCSMSNCTTPAVLSLYIKCLHTLHTIRRTAKLEKAQLEESILRMLYQCGLFLKQAGLFEQLWTLLQLYLELNLSPDNESKFGTHIAPNEKQLEELEEVVLNSQLPIHELWLRVEKLREACHWLPCKTQCEDPQRVVFSEDVSELIHPITMPGNTFKLTVTILTLLKLPLLPCRHMTMQDFGIDYVPWALDSIETLLPIFLPLYPIDIKNKPLLRYVQKLAVGPQYLKPLPGQEEYLQFILTIIRSCMDCLTGVEQTAIAVWWFRFQRLLLVLEKEELFKVTAAFKKKLKTESKLVLKSNSTNVALFKEYALVELESGNFTSAVNILETTITASQNSKPIMNITDEANRAAICSAHRSLIEMHMLDVATNKQKCLKYFIALMRGESMTDLPRFLTQGAINDTRNKFNETTSAILESYNNHVKDQGSYHFLPDFTTDWIICNSWFLYLNGSIDDCRILLENVIGKLESLSSERTWHKEVLYEFLVSLLYKDCTERSGCGLFPKLDSTLQKGIELYPNNLFFLSALAKVQSLHSCLGQPWWKIKSVLLKSGHALSTLFLILITNQRIFEIEENWKDTLTGQIITFDNSFKNRMLSTFRRLTRSDMCTRRCGLVWRLYLQFLHAYFDPKMCRDAYYSAVEECPWLKALYIDAAIYIPEELAQIQDLIIEKQLRIHVTPEELDVLRN